LSEALSLYLSRTNSPSLSKPKRQWRKFVSRVLAVVMVLGVIYAVMKMGLMVARVSRAALSDILRGAHRSNCGIGACHGPVPRRAAGLIHMGGGLGVGSIILLLLGTQWYIFFNVSVGASAIRPISRRFATCFASVQSSVGAS